MEGDAMKENKATGNVGVTRRNFVPGVAGAAAFLIVPRHVFGGPGQTAPSDKLNIAGVGVGAMGGGYLQNCESENIIALADVDHEFAARTFQRYPQAKTYRDFRVMLEKEKAIDAVVIGTPDHTHAVVALAAMRLGKHVYCAKPLTRTIFEARAVARAAREAKVATQMSVQSCASEAACKTEEWVRSGVIGQIREVHVWTDRPIWPQGLARPAETPPVPGTLDWDLWLGPAPVRPFHSLYHPFNWRGWYDFGTGALGDMACHAFHVPFRALDLQHPTSVHASVSSVMVPALRGDADEPWMRARRARYDETFPMASIVTWDFPARENAPRVRLFWYDGGLKPPRPPELEIERKLAGDGMLFVGERGVILSRFTGEPVLVPESRAASFTPPPPTVRRSVGHYKEWIAACKGGPKPNCNFEFGSLLVETALLGTIAQRTGEPLAWSAGEMRITSDVAADQFINPPYRAGWSL
jgi:predicted dehydrogenase